MPASPREGFGLHCGIRGCLGLCSSGSNAIGFTFGPPPCCCLLLLSLLLALLLRFVF